MPSIKNNIFLTLMIFTLLVTSAARPLQQPSTGRPVLKITQVDTSQFPKVTVYVSATDTAGEPMSINPAFLVLKEDGRVILPDQVNGTGEGGPLTTMLAIDTSGSMNYAGKMDIARSVAQDYIYQIRADDKAGILSFSNRISYVQAVTSDQKALIAAIEGLKADGDTAMYDALLKSVDILNPLPGRKAIIVMTDGLDNLSKHTALDVIQSIGKTGLSISTIGFGVSGQGTGNLSALDEAGLEALAGEAGGQYGFAKDRASLQLLYEKFGRSLKNEYVITYTSPSALRDGLSRNLTVSLMDGGLPALSSGSQIRYNPVGLVPESGGAAPWGMFFALLAGLTLILFLPTLIGKFTHQKKAEAESRVKLSPEAAKSRVKLS
jgi:Ca-activated chloride channel family protein